MTKLLFVDKTGTFGVIHENLRIDSPGDVDEEVHRFVQNVAANPRSPGRIDALHPEFTFELYARTELKEIYVHDRSDVR